MSAPVVRDPAARARHDVDQWVREHEAALLAVALRLTSGQRAEAADLVQDTFERALRNLDRVQVGSHVRAWLCTILRNLFIDRCRAPKIASEPVDDLQIAAVEPEPEPPWARITPEQLADALSRLEPDFRAVYDLATVESLSYVEIGERLGVPRATVGTRLMRARQKLRAMLGTGLDSDS
jgi:RNA polymerase sigma-70 factor (ECF subfamily)